MRSELHPMSSLAQGQVGPSKYSTPLKPILSRKQSVLGRRTRDDDDDEMATLYGERSPKKQKTVVFDESLNTVKQIGNKSLSDVKREVNRALDRHLRGEGDDDYDELKDIFATSRKNSAEDSDEDPTKSRELLLYVLALATFAPKLVRCHGLVKEVLRCSWLDRDDLFARAFTQYLASLSSCQNSCLTQALAMIVDKFSEVRPSMVPLGYAPVDMETRNERLHRCLRCLLDLSPAARPILSDLIASKFPYSEASTETHIEYVQNLLAIRTHTPDLTRHVLETIMLKVVKLDSEMQVDLADDTDDMVIEVLRQLQADKDREDDGSEAGDDEDDGDDDDSDADSVLSEELDEGTRRLSEVKSRIQTLDAILDQLFDLYSQQLEDPESDEAAQCFKGILTDFLDIVLVTYNSRHSQFIAFWAAQKSNEFISLFIGSLLTIALDNTRPALVRTAAVAYIGGFVARGAKVSAEHTRTVVSCLADYLSYFRSKYEPDCKGPDVRRYPIYYSFFQALLYIFAFRFRDLVVGGSALLDKDDIYSFISPSVNLIWMDGLRQRLSESIHCKLNPLKVCSQGIVQEFAKLSARLRFLFIYPRLEMNRSVSLSSIMSNVYATGGALREDTVQNMEEEKWTQLEAYYPFDPYSLPVSSRWLKEEDLYTQWQSIPGLRGNDEQEEDSDTDEEDEDADS